MAASDRATKDKAMAAYLKKKGVTRTTTACAHHCGAHPQLGEGFIRHLAVCRGTRRSLGRTFRKAAA